MSKSRDLGEFPAAALDIDASGNLDVTGTVTADGLVVDGASSSQQITFSRTVSSTGTGKIGSDVSQAMGLWGTDGTKVATFSQNKDISFYEDTGTTPKFFWDASAENLSLDSTGPYSLDISRNGGTDGNTSIRFKQLSSSWYAGVNGSNNFGINTAADLTNALFQITTAGNVGIGTISPSKKLEVSGNIYTNAQYLGGFGATTTGGTLDWNHVTNARSGSGYTLLTGSAANGPGGSAYYHAFSYEYNSKNGTGNITQLAFGYNSNKQYQRTRFSGTWSSWGAIL